MHSVVFVPAPYVKVYLMDGKRCVGKRKTKIARHTLDPLYQQALSFPEDYRGKILQVSKKSQSKMQYVDF